MNMHVEQTGRGWFRRFEEGVIHLTFIVSLAALILIANEAVRDWLHILVQPTTSSIASGSTISGHAIPPAQAGQGAGSHPISGSGQVASASELQQAVSQAVKPIDDRINQTIVDQRATFDRLITLVGFYSVVLGGTALFNLKIARDDAETQISQIKEARNKAVSDFDDKLSELPEMRRLGAGVQDLMASLTRVIGPENNWNLDWPYGSLSDNQRQEVLVSELTVAALPIFVSAKAAGTSMALARIYRSLARFYYGRYRVHNEPHDFARAEVYLEESERLDPKDAGTYRTLGAIYLGRNGQKRLLEDADSKEDAMLSLEKAEQFLRKAHELDAKDLGAYYNLALALHRKNALDEAIDWSRKALVDLKRYPEVHLRKYLPSIFANLACYYAVSAKTISISQGMIKKNLTQMIKTLSEGKKALEELDLTSMWPTYARLIEKEFGSGGDFSDLPGTWRDQIHKIIDSCGGTN